MKGSLSTVREIGVEGWIRLGILSDYRNSPYAGGSVPPLTNQLSRTGPPAKRIPLSASRLEARSCALRRLVVDGFVVCGAEAVSDSEE